MFVTLKNEKIGIREKKGGGDYREKKKRTSTHFKVIINLIRWIPSLVSFLLLFSLSPFLFCLLLSH